MIPLAQCVDDDLIQRRIYVRLRRIDHGEIVRASRGDVAQFRLGNTDRIPIRIVEYYQSDDLPVRRDGRVDELSAHGNSGGRGGGLDVLDRELARR